VARIASARTWGKAQTIVRFVELSSNFALNRPCARYQPSCDRLVGVRSRIERGRVCHGRQARRAGARLGEKEQETGEAAKLLAMGRSLKPPSI
jgi:hypothetical protein